MFYKSLVTTATLALTHVSAKRALPEGSLIVGYAPNCEQEKIINAVQTGINVLVWFSVVLVNDNGVPNVIPNV